MSVIAVRPVVTRIADELFQRLDRLTAGYSVYSPVVEVIVPTRLGGYTSRHLQIVLTRGTNERIAELDCPGNPPAEAHRQTFNIRCHILPSELDPTSVDEYTETLAADVQRVVTDASSWHTFGGLAINAEWQTMENIYSDGGLDGINLPLSVFYRTDESNPFNVRG